MLQIAGILLFVREIVFYIGFYLLGTSINWPASLSLPANEILPLIYKEQSFVFAGYYIYLLSQVLFVPIVFSLYMVYRSENYITNLLLRIGTGLAIISVCFKVLGIFRWLYTMPILAELAVSPNIEIETMQLIDFNYQLINAYAGKIGEHLGVQLFGSIVWGIFAFAFLRIKIIPRLFVYWLMISALLFIPLGDFFQLDNGVYLTINGITYSLWAIIFGSYLVFKNSNKFQQTEYEKTDNEIAIKVLSRN